MAGSISCSVLFVDSVVSVRGAGRSDERFGTLKPSLSSRQLISRKPFRIEAAILQDEDKKVVVGETLNLKGIPDDDGEAGRQKLLDGSFAAVVERGVIKLEQKINILLTELGGNNWWFDRFLAQHIAVFYYFMTVFMYILSPRMAYHFSECVESHAYETYDKFLKSHGDVLKQTPAPEIAVKYYTGGDLYLFANLYDVFWNIREDEGEHCKTMKACQKHGNLRSPHSHSEDELDDETETG